MKKFQSGGIIITYDLMKGYASNGNKIELIKLYKAITQCGLKEAKDAVEINCYTPFGIDVTKTVAFFTPFFQEEAITDPSNENIKNALNCILDNWQILGFTNPADGCISILHNFKRMMKEKGE